MNACDKRTDFSAMVNIKEKHFEIIIVLSPVTVSRMDEQLTLFWSYLLKINKAPIYSICPAVWANST
jgi:hypothetical protein